MTRIPERPDRLVDILMGLALVAICGHIIWLLITGGAS